MQEEINDFIDPEDYKIISVSVFKQAIRDYVRLMHPRFRKEKYLQEAFLTALCMLFDDSYCLEHIPNAEGEPLTLRDIISHGLGSDLYRIEDLHTYLVNEAMEFWETKAVKVFSIPHTIQIEGHVYMVQNHTNQPWNVDYENKIFYLKQTDINGRHMPHQYIEQNMLEGSLTIMFYHLNIPFDKQKIKLLSDAMYRLLKLNDCFHGTWTNKAELFDDSIQETLDID